MTAHTLDVLTTRVVNHLQLDVSDAVSSPREKLGDVRVDLKGGDVNWIEVKAQTMKQRFADITQADYVREGTDFLRSYSRRERTFDLLIKGDLREVLELDEPMRHGQQWELNQLWLADLALLVNDTKKKRAGATTGTGLREFLAKKYFLQFCMEGARLIRLDHLAPVVDILAGKPLHTKLNLANRGNVASIQVSAEAPPSRGYTDFTYHIGYKNAPGRHKLHDRAISRSTSLVIFRV